MSSNSKSVVGCGYCRNIPFISIRANWRSHQIKNQEGIVICPIIIERNTCKYCKIYGHKIAECPKIAEKKKQEEARIKAMETDFPTLVSQTNASVTLPSNISTISISYAQKAIEKRSEKMTIALQKEFDDRKTAEAAAKKQKQTDWENRQRERAMRKAEWEKNHANAMYNKYGTKWYRYVYFTYEDCDTAYDLREQEEESEYIRAAETEKYIKEKEQVFEKLREQLTEAEFDEMLDEEWESDYSEHLSKVSTMERKACPAALSYYQTHGIMYPAGDFVSTEWGAPRKIEAVWRKRENAEKKI